MGSVTEAREHMFTVKEITMNLSVLLVYRTLIKARSSAGSCTLAAGMLNDVRTRQTISYLFSKHHILKKGVCKVER